MRAWILLVCCAFLGAGCKLSKDESTLARLHEEMQNKKNQLPKSFPSESDLGVHYYPGCDYVQALHTDDFGAPLTGALISTPDSPDKVRDFYEKELGAKAMPTVAPYYSIQRDYNGKHYEVDYGPSASDTTITIKVYGRTR
ncbi:MAG: hypothetical protein ACHQ50_01005 [Fimbriimonadales bacterium]